MLRRLGLERPTSGLLRVVGLGKALGNGCIPWNELDPVAIGPAGIPLKTDHTELSRLHPADLADIVEQLDHSAAGYVLSTLDADTAADTLQEVDEEMQGTLLEHLDTERAADILERMSPDEAADLLGDLPEVRAAEVLERMEQDEAEDVRELLAYHEESAGGHMTTDYLALPPDLPVAAALTGIRAASAELDNVYYIYVTDPEEHLLGVLTLRQLIVADPHAALSTVMTTPAISVEADAGEEEVAAVLNKYHLLAVPVVDSANRLQGIVTVDDVLDTMLPEAVKRRLPRKYA
jgi:Mg2+ transporter MgtE